ncbi:MAG: hypothetical protein IJJ33_07030 [Victivallales bacterium]|nr:hypothetical protein [Victivallales bacterium]
MKKLIALTTLLLPLLAGASDARHCANLGLPVLIIGIDGAGVHSADEFCRLPSIDVIRDMLLQYMADGA